MGNMAKASGLITSRSIQMQNSAASASGVTYSVSFTAASAYATGLQGIVVDFCSDSPLIGNTSCTNTTSTSVGTPTYASLLVNGSSAGTWAAGQLNSNRTFYLACSASCPTLAASQTVTFNITSMTNPNVANTAFYARIYTYTTNVAAAYTLVSPGAYIDAGGIALSTGSTITINTNVQEQLIFCVSAGAIGNNCGSGVSTPTVNLGSGTPPVVGSSSVSTATVYTQTTTNAQGNVQLRMKGHAASYHTLYNAAHSFAAANSGLATNPGSAQAANVEFFGLNIASGTGYTVQAPYSGGAGYYGLDTTTGSANVNYTSGGSGSYIAQVATTVSGTVNGTPVTLTFGAETQPGVTTAGSYQAQEDLMATGTF
jgi:hypothetical protein